MLPTLLYGSEIWAPMVKQLKGLQSFVMHCLKVVLGVSVRGKQKNTDMRVRANIETVETMVRKKRLRWLGHVARTEAYPGNCWYAGWKWASMQLGGKVCDGETSSPRT